MSAADLASQAPALAWLSFLDAPISGMLSAEFNEGGQIASGSGSLDIAQGALHPAEGVAAIPFKRAGLAFAVDPATETSASPTCRSTALAAA